MFAGGLLDGCVNSYLISCLDRMAVLWIFRDEGQNYGSFGTKVSNSGIVVLIQLWMLCAE